MWSRLSSSCDVATHQPNQHIIAEQEANDVYLPIRVLWSRANKPTLLVDQQRELGLLSIFHRALSAPTWKTGTSDNHN